ncbi:MAG: hypothetical protein CMJ46_01170 [Planctomyces sp.]|nr:hypothetical protein [Planctomyces sp.]
MHNFFRYIFLPSFVLFSVSLGLLALVVSVNQYTEARSSNDWPAVPGEILSSEVYLDDSARDHDPLHLPVIKYQYEVDGGTYQSKQIQIVNIHSADPRDANQLVEKFPVGAAVQVFHDPEDPANAVLLPGRESSAFFGIIIGGVFVFITPLFVLGIYLLMRNQRMALFDGMFWVRFWRIGVPLMSIGFFTAGSGLLAYSVVKYYESLNSKTWPSVRGTIVESYIYTHKDDGEISYSAEIAYAYRVGKTRYTGERLTAFSTTSSRKEGAEKLVETYPVGKRLDVFYNPDKPKDSVLIPGEEQEPVGGMFAGGSFILAAAIVPMILLMIRYVIRKFRKVLPRFFRPPPDSPVAATTNANGENREGL